MKATYPAKTISEILDVTERRVRQLVQDGVIPKNSERGRYELIPTVRAYIHWLRDRSLYGEAKAANVDAVKNGFKSLADVMAEQGRDPVDTMSQLSMEKELAAALGLNLQLGEAKERQSTGEADGEG